MRQVANGKQKNRRGECRCLERRQLLARSNSRMQEITPFLWFDSNAEGAVNFYVSIFPNSRIASTNRYGEEGAKASGKAAAESFSQKWSTSSSVSQLDIARLKQAYEQS